MQALDFDLKGNLTAQVFLKSLLITDGMKLKLSKREI